MIMQNRITHNYTNNEFLQKLRIARLTFRALELYFFNT